MAGPLQRLTSKLYDTPHIVTQSRLDDIFGYLEERNLRPHDFPTDQELVNESARIKGEYEATELQIEDGIATLDLRGTTVYRESSIDAFCGLVSYQGLVRNIDTLVSRKDEVSLLAVFIDSPGGEAFRAFEAGRSVKEKLTQAGIRSVAYVDGIAASGGYVLASAFDEIVANPDSEVGSIGVRVALRNPSQEEKDRVLYVTAGENKVPFDAEGNFTESFINKIQTGINETYDTFVTYVADMRGMTREAVIDTKADTFSAKRSLEMGLIDKVMTGDEFVNYIADLKDSSTKSGNLLTVSADTDSRIEDDSVAEDSIVVESNENLNVEELSSDDTTIENGDIMSDKELSQLEVMEKTIADMQAQMTTLTEANAKLAAEKVAAEEAAAEELARKQEAIDAQDKEAYGEFLSGLSFVSDKEAMTDTLFKIDRFEAQMADVITSALTDAQAAIDAVPEQISVAAPEEEIAEEASEDEAHVSRVASRLKNLTNK
jgi:ClpP class serine protease